MPRWMKNRWGYAATAWLTSIVFVVIFAFILGAISPGMHDQFDGLQALLLMTLPIPFFAALFWPKPSSRRPFDLFLRGLWVVLLSITFWGGLIGILEGEGDPSSIIVMIFLFHMGSSIMTLFTLYLIAGGVSVLFADKDSQEG